MRVANKKRKPKPKQRSNKKCLCCDNRQWSRGLCGSCLQGARARIKSKQTTEAELIAAGLMLPVKPKGRPVGSPFAKRFAKMKK